MLELRKQKNTIQTKKKIKKIWNWKKGGKMRQI